jgi:hypothetical protein
VRAWRRTARACSWTRSSTEGSGPPAIRGKTVSRMAGRHHASVMPPRPSRAISNAGSTALRSTRLAASTHSEVVCSPPRLARPACRWWAAPPPAGCCRRTRPRWCRRAATGRARQGHSRPAMGEPLGGGCQGLRRAG